MILFDFLSKEVNRAQHKNPSPNPHAEISETSDQHASDSWNAYLKKNQSIIVDLFGGMFKSTTRCPNPACGKQSVVYETFNTV